MSEHLKTIEINGCKFEIDLRTAKQITTYRVGDKVKVLIKTYGNNYNACHGVIVAFDSFNALPTVTVCYISNDYSGEIKFASINKETTELEIAPCADDLLVEKADILAKLDREVTRKEAELEDLVRKRNYFLQRFGAYFENS
jgi:hypothetical protein